MAPRKNTRKNTDPTDIVKVYGRPLFQDPDIPPSGRRGGAQLDAEAQRQSALAREAQRQAANRAILEQQGLRSIIGGSPSQLRAQAESRVLGSKLITNPAGLSNEELNKLDLTPTQTSDGIKFTIGKGGGGLSASELAKQQWERVKRSWELEDRAFDISERERKALEEAAAGARQRTAYEEIADIYGTQGEEAYGAEMGDIERLYGGQAGEAERRREAALASLAAAVQESGGQIDAATAEALQNLVSTQAYSQVPLVELSPMQNLFTQALAAEGASAAGVEQQRAQDAALAAQFAQLARGAAQQLNVGEQNYLAALRNALTGGQAAGRSAVASRAAAERGGLESQYAQLVNQIAASRADAEREAERRRQEALLAAAKARAEAEAFPRGRTETEVIPPPAGDWMQYFR